MWVLTEDGALVNLDRVAVLRIGGSADGGDHVLQVEVASGPVVLARGSEAEMRARLLVIARQIDADIVGVLDVRTGKGAVG